MKDIFISAVIPIFNEEENLPVLTEKLTRVLSQYAKYEIIYINDGSKDNSERLISDYCKKNSSIKLINLSRNFGHQQAITAGLNYANGDAVVIMDGDLQDPPEVIPEFVDKWQEGYDVVYAIRTKRKENIFKKLAYFIFYRFLNKISDVKIPLDSGDFSILDKEIVNQLNLLPEKNRFVRGIRAWLGFKQIGIEYERDARNAGKPKYTFKKLLQLALDGILSFSHKPLIIATHLGMIITFISFISILVVIYLKLFTTITVVGYASYMTVMLFMGGIQLFMIGILGEYIGRIYDEVKNRPNYIVNKTQNIEM